MAVARGAGHSISRANTKSVADRATVKPRIFKHLWRSERVFENNGALKKWRFQVVNPCVNSWRRPT
eukprot:7501759-Lingulodinium_polyedra.AAC.1